MIRGKRAHQEFWGRSSKTSSLAGRGAEAPVTEQVSRRLLDDGHEACSLRHSFLPMKGTNIKCSRTQRRRHICDEEKLAYKDEAWTATWS